MFLSVGFVSLMGPLYWQREGARVAVGASGVAVRRMRRGGREDVRAPGSQDSLAVPELSGVRVIRASFFWQCQGWVAYGCFPPAILGSARAGWLLPDKPGSANVEWRMGAPRQKSLAVPGLGGSIPHYPRVLPHLPSAAPLPRPLNDANRAGPLFSGRHRTAAHEAPVGQHDVVLWESDIECSAPNRAPE